ncbi:MAG: MarR family winged helix-turn-helix transcriptional regulator [Actinomycetota bacterium]
MDALAQELLEAIPVLMRRIRREARAHRPQSLTVPQMRALMFVSRNPRTSLGALADHLGVTPPTTSALVERLVQLGLATRAPDPRERRRAVLTLSKEGTALLAWTQKQMRLGFQKDLHALSPAQVGKIRDALATLTAVLGEP